MSDAGVSDSESTGIEALCKSVRGLKGHLSRRITSATNAIRDAGERPTSKAMAELQRSKSKIQEQYEKIENCYTVILEMAEEEDYDRYEKELNDEAGRVERALTMVRVALNKSAVVPRGLANAPPNGSRETLKVKPNKTLEPHKLSRDHTTVEMKSWCHKFKAWYEGSNMAAGSVREQQAYFRMVLDVHLETKIFASVQENTPIFGTDSQVSCMSILEEEFLLRYPKVYRQMEFFEAKQSPGQLFSDWSSKLRALGDEAALSSLTTEDLYVMRYLTGTCDEKLREKFLKESKPSVKLFDMIVHQHEVAANTLPAVNKSSVVEAKQVNRQFGKPNRPKKVTMKELLEQKRCTRCGLQNHAANACQHKDAECHNCHGKGHLRRVCQSRSKDKQPTKARAVTGSPSVAAEEELPEYFSGNEDEEDVTVKRVLIRRIEGSSSRMIVRVNGDFDQVACADTGTMATILSHNVARRHGLRLFAAKERIFAANGERMKCEGRTPLKLEYGGLVTPVLALVSSDLRNEMLISEKDLKAMKILPKQFPDVLQDPENRVQANQVTLLSDKEKVAITEAIQREFHEVFKDKLPEEPMAGEPMEIHVKSSAIPTRCLTARSIPLHWQEPANEAIESLLQSGVLTRETEPTKWISPGFFVPKGEPLFKESIKKGMVVVTLKDLRLVVDYTGLNKYVERPVHPFPSTKDILQQLPKDGRFFATLDAVQGYHQIQLSEESSKLTTFLLPTGRYRFLRAPMGLSASSDEWCRRSDKVISGLVGVQKIVDDILITAPTLDVLKQRIREVLIRCRNENVTVSLKKFQIGQSVKFAGHTISLEGVAPDPDRLRAISDFKSPGNITELRSFLGLANQLGGFHPDLAHMTANLRGLLKAGTAFQWLREHQDEFDQVKRLLTSPSIVSFFDRDRYTELLTDASRKKGLGFALIQRDLQGQTHLIQCGSRSLTGAEENWATIELEAKAIEYGILKSRHYLLGHPRFTVVTDHRPLVHVFAKNMDDTLTSGL